MNSKLLNKKNDFMAGKLGKSFKVSVLITMLVLGLIFILYLLAGRYPKPGIMSPFLLHTDLTAMRVLFSLRLPRALGALLLGAVLGGSGAVFQSIFGNPLVDAGFLGVSQGAAFGAALALVAGAGSRIGVASASFAMALLALWASLALSKRFKFGGAILRLVLAGIAVSAFFSALLSIIKYTADPLSELPDIVFWTMGSLAGMGWSRLFAMLPASIFSLFALYLLRWRATVLSLDDDVSKSLGMKPETQRAGLAVLAAIGVAGVTASCGVVAWIGLVVPQFARILFGADGRKSIPISMIGGAAFALLSDGVARTVFPGEIPLGIVTALFGAVLFVLALASRTTELSR
jgi:iron complex transport system permease protein